MSDHLKFFSIKKILLTVKSFILVIALTGCIVSNVLTMENMFYMVTLSAANYDVLLTGAPNKRTITGGGQI